MLSDARPPDLREDRHAWTTCHAPKCETQTKNGDYCTPHKPLGRFLDTATEKNVNLYIDAYGILHIDRCTHTNQTKLRPYPEHEPDDTPSICKPCQHALAFKRIDDALNN